MALQWVWDHPCGRALVASALLPSGGRGSLCPEPATPIQKTWGAGWAHVQEEKPPCLCPHLASRAPREEAELSLKKKLKKEKNRKQNAVINGPQKMTMIERQRQINWSLESARANVAEPLWAGPGGDRSSVRHQWRAQLWPCDFWVLPFTWCSPSHRHQCSYKEDYWGYKLRVI